MCPDPDFTTLGTGAITAEDCDVRNCDPGFKAEGDNCTACSVGEFQSERAKIACVPCPTNKTTLGVGSASEDDCIRKLHNTSLLT